MKKALIVTLSALACSPAYADDLFIFEGFNSQQAQHDKRVQKNLAIHKRQEATRKERRTRTPIAIKRSKSYTSGRVAPRRATGRVPSNRMASNRVR